MRCILFVLIATVGFCAGCDGEYPLFSNEKAMIKALKLIRDASVEFRDQDCDRNGIKDYWMADVSGLYRVLNDRGDEIKKIPRELAMADRAPMAAIANYVGATLTSTPVPYHGYYFCVMTMDETGTSYCLNTLADAARTAATNGTKFAFCAYPAIYDQTGKNTFIVSEEGTVWKHDPGSASPILTWPKVGNRGKWSTTD